MSVNIVVLSGAPRREGNTERLAAAFVAGAEAAGKKVTTFRTADMKIGGCKGCGHCLNEKGVCVQKDDMPGILDALRQADALALVSPVYFFDVSAQLKLAIDRTFALGSEVLPIKKAALLMTCADPSKDSANGAIVTYRSICAYLKWEDAGIIVATGLQTPGEIDGRNELDQAKAIGQEI